mgnify:FL=1|tara:strand:+ start:3306 stop:3497 length:192 start_codon:yes stop_codon:yes gene_type:complete
MWLAVGRVLMIGFSALGVADIFGLGDDDNGSPSSLWSNPLVIMGLLITIIIVLNNLSKLKLIK